MRRTLKGERTTESEKQEFKLVSRRGTRISGGICSGCRMPFSHLMKYEKSSIGRVYLCNSCKAEAFDRSFGKKDMLDMPEPLVKQGGLPGQRQ